MKKIKNKYIYKFGEDFNSDGGALTLKPSEVSKNNVESGIHTRTHEDGWTITGEVHEDFYTWVNDFKASHPTLGTVEGNFEDEVVASSQKAFKDFYQKHTPNDWDYGDI
jgi:hypothetical protein